jgi:hypothetical protein
MSVSGFGVPVKGRLGSGNFFWRVLVQFTAPGRMTPTLLDVCSRFADATLGYRTGMKRSRARKPRVVRPPAKLGPGRAIHALASSEISRHAGAGPTDSYPEDQSSIAVHLFLQLLKSNLTRKLRLF